MAPAPRDSPELYHADADVVRGLITASVFAYDEAPASLGTVTLWDHQREAVARLRTAIDEFGGALLADEVGLGKTYVALALAARYRAPVVVAPAALCSMWNGAFTAASLRLPWISVESLSRGSLPAQRPDLIILDEAHHARNPATRRYRSLARLCEHAHLLLLSATPIHNARRDLVALLALFLGAQAAAASDATLARIIVRRTRAALSADRSLPVVSAPIALPVGDDAATPKRILTLPPPLPPAGAGSADALVAFTLIRLWASSVGALRGALRRRTGRARALIETLVAGRLPSRAEIDAWVIGEDAQQLAFAELLAPRDRSPLMRSASSIAEMLRVARTHEQALHDLDRSLGDGVGVDGDRAAALRRVLDAHPGEKVLAFSQFADTVGAYWRLLRGTRGACALTADGARVAGGNMSRTEAIGRFSPLSNGGRQPRAADDVRLLLTTDLLSEGVNLQDASVVVHLDLPWTAARIEQRVGRVARAGSRHGRVSVYTMSPPVSGEMVLEIERRLHEKIAAAAAAVGAPASHFAGQPGAGSSISPPAASEALRAAVRCWPRASRPESSVPHGIRFAAVGARRNGWIALLRSASGERLVAALDDRIADDVALLAEVASLAGGVQATGCFAATAVEAVATLQRWLDGERAAALAGVPDILVARHRRSSYARLAGLESAPRTRRVALDSMAGEARRLSATRMGVEREQRLRAASGDPDDGEWLRRVASLGLPGQDRATNARGDEATTALLLLVCP
jgi:superfamily II DNA or RNA helicase